MPFRAESAAPRVVQVGEKEWRVQNASRELVRTATKDALRRYGPVMEGRLPLPMKLATAAMVGAVTRNVFDEGRSSYGKEHLLGPSLYRTELHVGGRDDDVRVSRHTEGILGPGANVGDFGRALQAALDRQRRR
jgi:hypothetical protein